MSLLQPIAGYLTAKGFVCEFKQTTPPAAELLLLMVVKPQHNGIIYIRVNNTIRARFAKSVRGGPDEMFQTDKSIEIDPTEPDSIQQLLKFIRCNLKFVGHLRGGCRDRRYLTCDSSGTK